VKKMNLLDADKARADLIAAASADDDTPMGRIEAVVRQWDSAIATFQSGKFNRLPEFAVNRWKDVPHMLLHKTDPAAFSDVGMDQIIVFGRPGVMLCAASGGKKLMANQFARVKEDLCETSDLSMGMQLDYTAADTAAAAGRRSPPPVSNSAAAASAGPNRR
jgi:hypothetical protein